MIDGASEAAGVELSENGGRGVGYVGWGWGGGVGVCYSGFRGPSLGLSVDFEVSLEHSQMGAFCLDVARPLPWRPFHPFWSVLSLSSSSPQQEDSALMTSVLQFSHLQEVRTQKNSEEFTQVFSTSEGEGPSLFGVQRSRKASSDTSLYRKDLGP